MTKGAFKLAVLSTVAAIVVTAAASWALFATGGIALHDRAALAAYALTQTGGSPLVALVILVALGVWSTDPGADSTRRRREAAVMLLTMVLALPFVAVVNEDLVKPAFAEPRPSHRQLTEAGVIADLDAFFRLDSDERRRYLASRTARDEASKSLHIHPVILEHWIHQTGYTFPSGHAVNAFIIAVLFLGAALANPTRRRRWLAGCIMGWAVAVALSRVLLEVHRPLDVTAGALTGAVVGALLLIPWWRWTRDRSAG